MMPKGFDPFGGFLVARNGEEACGILRALVNTIR